MKVALIARSTLYQVFGGITVQVTETARHLRLLGVDARVHLSGDDIRYRDFDLLHFFDITRPANIIYHIRKSGKPFVLTPVLIDYSEYDRQHRKGFSGMMFRQFSPQANEYLKTVSRWVLRRDGLPGREYLWKGQDKSIRYILDRASLLLPNSEKEIRQLNRRYSCSVPYRVIPNGINTDIFYPDASVKREKNLVVCAARIEGIKNQLNLVRALNQSPYSLLLIGDSSPNQKKYAAQCRKEAASNTCFAGRLPQQELLHVYRKAAVHILPSWFETCGLSSLEAAATGCPVVISDKGFSREYFGDDAVYCDPGDPASIRQAVDEAAARGGSATLREKIEKQFTWKEAARQTLGAYLSLSAHGSIPKGPPSLINA